MMPACNFANLSVVSLLTVMLALPCKVSAQTDIESIISAPTGTPIIPVRNGYVNLNGGNLHLEIPVQAVPERGSSPATSTFVYNSTFWQLGPGGGVSGGPVWTLTGGPLWSFTVTNGLPALGYASPINIRYVPCGSNSGIAGTIELYTAWTYTDPAGNTHYFEPGVTSTDNCVTVPFEGAPTQIYPNGYAAQTAKAFALDGSGYLLSITNGDNPSITAPDGSTYSTTVNGNMGGLDTVNPDGSTLSVAESDFPAGSGDAAPGPWLPSSGSLSCPEFMRGDQSPYSPQASITCTVGIRPMDGTSITSGNPPLLTMVYEYVPVCTAFYAQYSNTSTSFANYDFCGGIWTVQSITLPDQVSTYLFSYDTGTSPGHYGQLTQMTLPTGGVVKYSYYPSTGSGLGFASETRGDIQSVTDNAGTTTFSRTFCPVNTGGCYQPYLTTTVTYPSHILDPLVPTNIVQDQSIFSATTTNANTSPIQGQVIQQDYLAGTLTKTTSWDTTIIGTPSFSQVTWNQTGTTDRVEYKYGPGSVVQRADEFVNGTLYRTELKNYQQDTASIAYVSQYNMFTYPTLTQILDGSGNVLAQETRTYDEYGASYCTNGPPGVGGAPMLTNISGAVRHDDVNYGANRWARGNPTTITTSTSANSSVTRHFCYDTLGNVTEAVDGNGNPTRYSYADNFADTSCIASNTPTYALPTLITDALGHQTKITYGSCLRSPVQTQGPNDLAAGRTGTTQSYYPDGRPNCSTSPDGGKSCLQYSDVNTTLYTQLVSSTAGSHVVSTVVDGYGNNIKTIDQSAGSEVDKSYDSYGRVSTVSNPIVAGSGGAIPVTTYAYDGLGRPTAVLRSDGSSEQTNIYTGQNIDTYGEAGVHHQLVYDATGRLVTVFELGTSSSPVNYETDYTYDAVNNLTRIDQWGGPKGTSGEVVRQFGYDWLGRIKTSINPETGTICYGVWSGNICSGGYDAVGNVLFKTDGRNVTTAFTYDALNRLVQKSVPIVSSTTTGGLSEFMSTCYQFDTLSGAPASANLVGHLVAEWTQTGKNCANAYSPSISLTAKGISNYDPMGRPLTSQQCVKTMCQNVPFKQNQTYDLAGHMTSWTDGRGLMSFSQQFDSAGRPMSLTNSVSGNGFPSVLFSVQGYTPASSLQNWTVGDGYLNFFRSYDNRLRVTSEAVTH